MKSKSLHISLLLISIACLMILASCNKAQGDVETGAPPPARIVRDVDVILFKVEHPEQFPFATATAHKATSQLVVTGTVNPDVSRNVPVISLVSGRIVAIRARLGDTVKEGQHLLSIRSDDITEAYSTYRKAVADEILTRTQFERARDLHGHGAISMNDLQVAQNTEDKAKVDVETSVEHLKSLGKDPQQPNPIVEIFAPVSGVITDQQVTNAAGVQALGSNPFTISDLSYVWIICDVYENDLPNVHMGDPAEIHLNAYPGQVFHGRVSNIGTILDPQIRTAKVRIEVRNPGTMRLGMFITATFRGQTTEMHTAVPATAILRMHDRDYVFVPAPDGKFQRLEVVSGDALPGNLQEIKSGINPGQQVVANALVLDRMIGQ